MFCEIEGSLIKTEEVLAVVLENDKRVHVLFKGGESVYIKCEKKPVDILRGVALHRQQPQPSSST